MVIASAIACASSVPGIETATSETPCETEHEEGSDEERRSAPDRGHIAAPVDVVWDALRSKETIRQWMGWDYDGLDGEIDLIFFTGTDEDPSAHSLTLHGGDEFTPRGQR
jgi:hypothetical protein